MSHIGTVNELLEAGADPTIPNKDGDLPADLLSYGTKSRSQLGQDLLARLKRGQAEMNVNASDIANDDDVADDGEGKCTVASVDMRPATYTPPALLLTSPPTSQGARAHHQKSNHACHIDLAVNLISNLHSFKYHPTA